MKSLKDWKLEWLLQVLKNLDFRSIDGRELEETDAFQELVRRARENEQQDSPKLTH